VTFFTYQKQPMTGFGTKRQNRVLDADARFRGKADISQRLPNSRDFSAARAVVSAPPI
jgi:hypothetical protein